MVKESDESGTERLLGPDDVIIHRFGNKQVNWSEVLKDIRKKFVLGRARRLHCSIRVPRSFLRI
jgi:hypothetical protein